MPLLVKFVINWNAIGIGVGWLVLAGLLIFDVSGIGSMVWHQSDGLIALYILMLSFAVTSGPVAVTAAVLWKADFGDTGNTRLERWKAGYSAELPEVEEDRPKP